MERRFCAVLLWLIVGFFILVLAGLRPAASAPLEAGEDTPEAWARENYGAVLELLFKKGCPPANESRSTRWELCVEILPGFQTELEYTLSLQKSWDGKVFAVVVRPQNQSIYTQLCKLRSEHSDAPADRLAELVALDVRKSDLKKLPELRRLADEFERIRIAPSLSEGLMMDPTKYEVHTTSSSGEHMELVLLGPGPSAPKQPSPILRWIESLRQTLTASMTAGK